MFKKMNKTILVSLVSDQTIPNVQLIKEFKHQIDDFLFITTDAMEKKGCRQWIELAANVQNSQIRTINPYSFDDIVQKLDSFDFSLYDRVIVNLTGGTKIMSLVTSDYFKELGAEIYYIPGNDKSLLKLFPGRKKEVLELEQSVSLKEYLVSYGFTINESQASGFSKEYTQSVFDKFVVNGFTDYINVLSKLRDKREKSVEIATIENLTDFLNYLEFPIMSLLKLTKLQVKYFTGEWFEEYVADRLTDELGESLDMSVGIQIKKDQIINEEKKSFSNEMDILFMYKNKFYSIECKTSVFDTIEEKNERGETIYKERNILGETIYKSDSLKQKFGLFAHTYIFILDSIGDKREKLKSHLERAELSNITIIDRDMIVNCNRFSELLNIKNQLYANQPFQPPVL